MSELFDRSAKAGQYDDEDDDNPRWPPKKPTQELMPRDDARKLGINFKTGEPLPQLRREYAPQDRFLRDLTAAYDGIGGLAMLTRWAKQNKTEFIKILRDVTKAAPITITDSEVTIIHALPSSKLDE